MLWLRRKVVHIVMSISDGESIESIVLVTRGRTTLPDVESRVWLPLTGGTSGKEPLDKSIKADGLDGGYASGVFC